MAKTKGGNPVIGTVLCRDPDCTETTTVHQIQSGTRKDELYTRCPECKANQSAGELLQKYIHENAIFREGFEHLSTQNEEAESHEELETEAVEVEENEVLAPEETKKSKKGWIALGLGVVFVGVGVVLGVKPK